MPSTFKLSILFLFVVALVSLASAVNVEAAIHQNKRQNTPIGTGVSPSSPLSSSSSDSDTSSSSSSSETSHDSDTTSSRISTPSSTLTTPSPTTPITTKPSSSAAPTSSATPSTTPRDSSTSAAPSSESAQSTKDSSKKSSPTITEAPTSKTQAVVTTVVTVKGSSTFSHVLTTSALLPVSTGSATSTSAPSLDSGNGSSGSSGLSSKGKKTIIGVVVGIGGAILLGGLAVVAWRIWGRRRHDVDEDDLMNDPGSAKEKSSNSSGSTPLNPFKKTLDQYHNPGPVNTASNF